MYADAGQSALYEGVLPSGIRSEPLIINVCLTGNVLDRRQHPHLPTSISEIVEDGLQVIERGASMLHIHARGEDGLPEWRPEPYARILESIRRHARDAVLIVTTSGRQHGSIDRRAAVLELDGDGKPDMASLTLGSLNFPATASINAPETIQQLAARMRERDIMPELEAFDLGMLNYAFYMRRKGMLPRDCYINLLLGSLGTVPGRILDLCNLVRELPSSWSWAAAGIGRYQLAMNSAAIVMGGHVRTGLEDNPYMDYRDMVPASNVALVDRVVRLARELGRPVSTPAQTRARLRIGDSENWQATRVEIRPMREEELPAVIALLDKWNMAPVSGAENGVRPERDHVEIGNSFVAVLHGRLVGIASFLPMGDARAETASLAVDPQFLGCGIGYALQTRRLEEMRARGIRHVQTEADRPNVIRWYIDKFGYRMTGKTRKRHAFGAAEQSEWTVLELDLGAT